MRLLPSHRTLVRAVSDCQRFCAAAGIAAVLAAGMRLSRSFALPAPPSCKKVKAIGRQTAGERPCKRPANALDSAGTFGAKRSRGLPPNRWVQSRSQPQSQPRGGSLRANGPANGQPTHLTARAPSVRNVDGGCRPTAGSRCWGLTPDCLKRWRRVPGFEWEEFGGCAILNDQQTELFNDFRMEGGEVGCFMGIF